MLVISRKRNDTVVINHEIIITVIEVVADKVRLGIEAPRDAFIRRKELYEPLIKNQSATSGHSSFGEPVVALPSIMEHLLSVAKEKATAALEQSKLTPILVDAVHRAVNEAIIEALKEISSEIRNV